MDCDRLALDAARRDEDRLEAFALSADGQWALTMPLDPPERLVLLPTGAGEPGSGLRGPESRTSHP